MMRTKRSIETKNGLGNIEELLTQVESFSGDEKKVFAGNLENQELLPKISGRIDKKVFLEKQLTKKYREKYDDYSISVELELSKFKDIEGFDPKEIREKAMEALLFVLANNNIPNEVKDKMLVDFKRAIGEIEKADLGKIEALKKLRGAMSLGLNKEDTDGDYLHIIIGQVFTNAITMKASVISRCFLDETEKMGNTIYHKETLDTLKTEISELDVKYGLDIYSIIGKGIEKSSSMKVLNKILRAADLSKAERAHIRQQFTVEDDDWETHIGITIGGKPYDLLDLLGKYDDVFGKFKKGQNSQFTNIRRDILDEGNQWLEGKTEDLIGMEKIDTDIDIKNQFQEKVEKMKLADLVIILNQLAGIAPVYGGVQDISVAYSGIEADGRLPGGFERSFLLVVGALDVSIAGSGFAKLGKAGKIAKYISLLGDVKTAFKRRDILEEILSLGDSKIIKKLIKVIPGLDNELKAIKLVSKSLLENFDELPKSAKVTELLEKFPNIKPEKEITIDGINYVFSKVFTGGKSEVVGFVEINGQIEPRLFYKSASDGGWRTTPGCTFGGKYSKAEGLKGSHYTVTTKIDHRLENFINEELTKDSTNLNIRNSFKGGGDKNANNIVNGHNFEAMVDEVSVFDDKNTLSTFREGRLTPGQWGEKGSVFEKMNPQQVKDYLSNLEYPDGFLPDFSKGPKETYNVDHTIAGPTKVDVFEGILNGEKIEWHISTSISNPNQVWISNIRLANGKMSSFGNDTQFINSGLLTQKPFEYMTEGTTGQLPEAFHDGRDIIKSHYYDITDVLGGLKPISDYKVYKQIIDILPVNLGDKVMISRSTSSGGGETLGEITSISIKGKVKVSFVKENGEKAYKTIDYTKVKVIPYKVGEEVMVPRSISSGGGETEGKVSAILPDGKVRVDFLDKNGKKVYKSLNPSRIRTNPDATQEIKTISKIDIETMNRETLDLFNNFPSLRYDTLSGDIFKFFDDMAVDENLGIIKKAKEITKEFILDPNVSTESILYFMRTSDLWMDKLSGGGIFSLTHVMESMMNSCKIPKNQALTDLLKMDFGDISQEEFFSFISLHHDLEKNFGMVRRINEKENLADLFKGRNLSSHQLDSANLLRDTIKEGNKSDVYNSIQKFLTQKGVDIQKTDEFINLMADTIAGHAGNTEFIQLDTISGLQKIWKNSVDIGSSIGDLTLKQQKSHIIDFLGNLKKEGGLVEEDISIVSDKIKESESLEEMMKIINSSLMSKYLKVTLGKDIDLNARDIKNIEKLLRSYPVSVDKVFTIQALLKGDMKGTFRIKAIVNEKMNEYKIHGASLGKYLHTREFSDSGKEAGRFAFNISDIIGYAQPSSESFIKLISFRNIKTLMSSPIDSAIASLAEVKFALSQKKNIINVEAYEKMYNEGIENLGRLMDAYRIKMGDTIGDNAPKIIRELGSTFEEAYTNAINLENELENSLEMAINSGTVEKSELIKMNDNMTKTLGPIRNFFVDAFSDMCRNL